MYFLNFVFFFHFLILILQFLYYYLVLIYYLKYVFLFKFPNFILQFFTHIINLFLVSFKSIAILVFILILHYIFAYFQVQLFTLNTFGFLLVISNFNFLVFLLVVNFFIFIAYMCLFLNLTTLYLTNIQFVLINISVLIQVFILHYFSCCFTLFSLFLAFFHLTYLKHQFLFEVLLLFIDFFFFFLTYIYKI